MPPLLQEEERKPRGILGRIYEYISPNIIKMGGWVLKFMGAWYLFLGVLGLFMRIHNYAWGDDEDDDYDEKDREEEVIRGDAKGYPIDMDEKTAQRQKLMWERKAQNHAKFAANREAKKKKKAGGGNGNRKGEKKTSDMNDGGVGDDDDDNFEGIGRSVKRSEARQAKVDAGKASKSKTNAQWAKAEARKDSTSKKN